jgi:hypothetical protein
MLFGSESNNRNRPAIDRAVASAVGCGRFEFKSGCHVERAPARRTVPRRTRRGDAIAVGVERARRDLSTMNKPPWSVCVYRRLLGVAFGLGEPITLSINSELQSYSKRAFGERVRSPFGFVSATLVSIGSCVCTPPCCRAKAIMTLLRSSPLAHEKARTEARAPIAKWQIRNVCDCAVATGRCWYG